MWAVIFSTFAIPLRYQHRVLFWGIFGALVLRAIFIFAGTALIEQFWWLLARVRRAARSASGIKVVAPPRRRGPARPRPRGEAARAVPPGAQASSSGQHFLVRDAGKWVATPLLAALVVVEVTDVIFAVDSVPAILAVSREPFIVFASNAFAILGLRALYFVLGGASERFHYLSHALGAILVFVGIKMTVSHWWHMPTAASLAVIVVILAAAIVLSVRKDVPRRRSERSGSTIWIAGVPRSVGVEDLGVEGVSVPRPSRDPRGPGDRAARVRPDTMPEVGRQVGRTIREFKQSSRRSART